MNRPAIKSHLAQHWKFWVVFVTALLFALFVWPSMWTYRTETGPTIGGQHWGSHTVRIDRITGR